MADILVIDNDKHIIRLMTEILTKENHKVDYALKGSEAVKLINHKEYDVSFIDLDLPDIDGLTVLKNLRQISPLTAPVIITGQCDINWAIESIKTGIYEFVKKPFDIDDIIKITDKALIEKSKMVSSGYVYKDSPVTIQPDKKKRAFKLAIDTIILTAALLFGFLAQQKIFTWQGLPLFWSVKEIVYLLLSFACCHIYLSSRSNSRINYHRHNNPMRDDLKNLTYSYIIFAAIMFFATNFYEARLALFTGYLLGIIGLRLPRADLASRAARLSLPGKEGSRSLTFKIPSLKIKTTARKNAGYSGESVNEEDNIHGESNNEPCLEYKQKLNGKSSLIEDYKGKRSMVKRSRKLQQQI
jgi:DNA-binding response OmpR family regulator